MQTLVTVMLVFLIAWGLFTAYMLIDMWRRTREIAKAAEDTLSQARVQATSAAESRAELRRLVLLARAEYCRQRGLEEPDADQVRAAFSGF